MEEQGERGAAVTAVVEKGGLRCRAARQRISEAGKSLLVAAEPKQNQSLVVTQIGAEGSVGELSSGIERVECLVKANST